VNLLGLVDDSSINAEALKEFELRNAQHLFKVGYTTKYSKWSYTTITAFNFILAILLIICSLPLGLLIALMIREKDGGPVFYKGARLGLNKKIFFMYKFRTLPYGAQNIIGPKLLTHIDALHSSFGKFLRDTRLDELPQLINIIKGEMDFIGPRPVRPEIYESLCKDIKHYDNRFVVRPGLIGYSQLFSPHSSPKRLRSMIDNLMLLQDRKLLWDLFLIFLTIKIVVKAVFTKTIIIIVDLFKIKIIKNFIENRFLERINLKDSTIYLHSYDEVDFRTTGSRGIDINENCIRIHSNEKLEKDKYHFKFMIQKKKNNRTKFKYAVCTGEIVRSTRLVNDPVFHFTYLIQYKAVSPFNQYIIDAYFLKKSMV
jgi:lipopolysaccharide/colanic/teichoic acid biosynthesis glycosyltransferase